MHPAAPASSSAPARGLQAAPHRLLLLMMVMVMLAAALAAPGGAWAGSLGISPLRLDFAADRAIAVLTITNPTAETVAFELEAAPWPADAAGQSVRDLVVNPPTATLLPGRQVTVRVGLVRRPAADRERAYRLLVTELAKPQLDPGAVGVRLRVSLPIFVAPAQPQRTQLQWAVQRDARGEVLVAINPGNVHERVHNLALLDEGGGTLPVQGPTYVLPGGRAEFPLPETDGRGGPWRLQGRTLAGGFDRPLEALRTAHEVKQASAR